MMILMKKFGFGGSHTSFFRAIAIILFVITLLLLNNVNAVDLSVPEQYTTIQAAVTAATNGDIIKIASGTYPESVLITSKTLTLEGIDSSTTTVVTGNGSNNGIFRILSSADVTIKNIKLSGNTIFSSSGGGAFVSGAKLSLISSEISNNEASLGGAIYAANSATIIIEQCTINNNRANDGGAIYATGNSQINIEASLITANTATNVGGIFASGNINMYIENTSISSNPQTSITTTTTGNALHAISSAAIVLVFCTVVGAGNGPVISNAVTTPTSTITVRESILVRGAATVTSLCAGNSIIEIGNNIVEDNTCPGLDSIIANPLINNLADNGGPTRTHALQASSPAINAASTCSVNIDQRLFPRNVGICDIGAYEFGSEQTNSPTATPSNVPSSIPSYIPSSIPTTFPSITPSLLPTTVPTMSQAPSTKPTASPGGPPPPSASPSAIPSVTPTNIPSLSPSNVPTSYPTTIPSTMPSTAPSASPSLMPSNSPTGTIPTSSAPTSLKPTEEPTEEPTEAVTDNDCDSPVNACTTALIGFAGRTVTFSILGLCIEYCTFEFFVTFFTGFGFECGSC